MFNEKSKFKKKGTSSSIQRTDWGEKWVNCYFLSLNKLNLKNEIKQMTFL